VRRVYELEIEPHGRKVRLDGKAPRPLARYFGDFNVVLFAPEDLSLPRGAPAERRRFLDRAVFNRQPGYIAIAADYDKVLRSRNRVLRDLGEGRGNADMLAVYDEQLAGLGAQIIGARRAYLGELAPKFRAAFEAITRTGNAVDLGYQTIDDVSDDERDVEALLAAAFATDRARDLARGSTSTGPHRDDLAFVFDTRDAGGFASQGQLRAIVLAWKTAELELLRDVHGEDPILLLDDVSSELDEHRNAYLFEYLATLAGQCFVTTTHRKHVLVAAQNRVDYQVREGRIFPAETAS
jgi:DNA replication and repair protein RecF